MPHRARGEADHRGPRTPCRLVPLLHWTIREASWSGRTRVVFVLAAAAAERYEQAMTLGEARATR